MHLARCRKAGETSCCTIVPQTRDTLSTSSSRSLSAGTKREVRKATSCRALKSDTLRAARQSTHLEVDQIATCRSGSWLLLRLEKLRVTSVLFAVNDAVLLHPRGIRGVQRGYRGRSPRSVPFSSYGLDGHLRQTCESILCQRMRLSS